MTTTRLGSIMLTIHRMLTARGSEADALAGAAGIRLSWLFDPDARVPDVAARRFWELAREATGDDALGIDVAQHLHPTSLHGLGYAWLASATLLDALQRVVRYSRVMTDVEKLVLHDEGSQVRVEVQLPEGRLYSTAEAYDAFLAGIVVLSRASAGESFRPLGVQLMRVRPACADRFDTFFRGPVAFGALEYSITFARSDLERRLPTANAELALASEQVVRNYLARLDRHDVAAAARRAIVESLPAGRTSQSTVARVLNLGMRTLQRRLEDQGLTFKGLLEATRRELAVEYLRDANRSVSETAYLVGFSDLSNFSNAFKRWTGQTPSAFRAPVDRA
jgi:AraC-like DNA-binding protein